MRCAFFERQRLSTLIVQGAKQMSSQDKYVLAYRKYLNAVSTLSLAEESLDVQIAIEALKEEYLVEVFNIIYFGSPTAGRLAVEERKLYTARIVATASSQLLDS